MEMKMSRHSFADGNIPHVLQRRCHAITPVRSLQTTIYQRNLLDLPTTTRQNRKKIIKSNRLGSARETWLALRHYQIKQQISSREVWCRHLLQRTGVAGWVGQQTCLFSHVFLPWPYKVAGPAAGCHWEQLTHKHKKTSGGHTHETIKFLFLTGVSTMTHFQTVPLSQVLSFSTILNKIDHLVYFGQLFFVYFI